jgi:hypothetical protein
MRSQQSEEDETDPFPSIRRRPHWAEPFFWWGPIWHAPDPRPMRSLVGSGMLSREIAALLIALVEQGQSVIVASERSAAGKSTLLWSLLDFVPSEVSRIYVRGSYEPFDFVDQTDPGTAIICINEISPHLPVYIWGPPVERVLELGLRGYQLAATAHGRSVADLISVLGRSPLKIPLTSMLAFDVAVFIDTAFTGVEMSRNVVSVVGLREGETPGSIQTLELLRDDGEGLDVDNFELFLLERSIERDQLLSRLAELADCLR